MCHVASPPTGGLRSLTELMDCAFQMARRIGAGPPTRRRRAPRRACWHLVLGADELALADGLKEGVTAVGKADPVVDPFRGWSVH